MRCWPDRRRNPLPVRIVQLADLTEVAYRRRGLDAAREYARKQRGKSSDPALAALFITDADDAAASWPHIITSGSTARATPAASTRGR